MTMLSGTEPVMMGLVDIWNERLWLLLLTSIGQVESGNIILREMLKICRHENYLIIYSNIAQELFKYFTLSYFDESNGK